MFYKKYYIESSPQEIWLRIRFLEINGYPSLTDPRTFYYFAFKY